MSKKIGISIISEIADLTEAVNLYVEHISGEPPTNPIELPHILNALNEWEEKNIPFLNMDECFRFGQLKKRIENLMNEFQMTT